MANFFSPLTKKNFGLGAKIKTFLNLIGLKIEIEFLLLLVSQTATIFFGPKSSYLFFVEDNLWRLSDQDTPFNLTKLARFETKKKLYFT